MTWVNNSQLDKGQSFWARVQAASARSRPTLVRSASSGKWKVAMMPWSVQVRRSGQIRLGEHVRILRGATLDATNGLIVIGNNSVVCRFAVLEAAGGPIVVGNSVSVGDYCSLHGQAGLHIGDDVLLASGVRLVPSSHTFSSRETPIRAQGMVGQGIRIESGAWLGANVVVLDGVVVGEGAIVGAGSVVTKDIEPMSIYAGAPARLLRERP